MADIRITTPTDVLDAVPALLRFYPTESLVGLFLEHTPAGTLLAVTARFDLPDTPADTHAMTAQIVEMLTRHHAAIFVLYTADQDEARTTMQALLSHLDPAQIRLAVLATLPGWTTVDPDQPHTINWTNPYPTHTGTVAAQFAQHGTYALGTRDDLADSIAAPDAATTEDYTLGRSLDPIPAHPTPEQTVTLTEDVVRWITAYLQPADHRDRRGSRLRRRPDPPRPAPRRRVHPGQPRQRSRHGRHVAGRRRPHPRRGRPPRPGLPRPDRLDRRRRSPRQRRPRPGPDPRRRTRRQPARPRRRTPHPAGPPVAVGRRATAACSRRQTSGDGG